MSTNYSQAQGASAQYDFSSHAIESGTCVALGNWKEIDILTPAPAFTIKQELEDMRTGEDNEEADHTLWGDPASPYRILRSVSWVLNSSSSSGKYCSLIGMLDSEFSSIELQVIARDAISDAAHHNISLIPLYDEYQLDEALHSDSALSGHDYSDVKLVSKDELALHQEKSKKEFFFECLAYREDVIGMIDKAQYVLVCGSTFGIDAQANDSSYGSGGGPAELITVLETCSMDNKAIFMSLVGSTFNRFQKRDIFIALQFVDFLLITELECRRLIILLQLDPNKSLEDSAQILSEFSKVAGQRSRIVIVIPNPGDLVDSNIVDDDEIDVLAPGKDDEAKSSELSTSKPKTQYDKMGNQIYAEFKEYDRNIHNNLNELNDKILVAASGDCYYIDGWPTCSQSQESSTTSIRPVSSTYFHNQSVDFRLNIDKMSYDMADPDMNEINTTVSSKEHLSLADQFFGGFVAMVIRSEAHINASHCQFKNAASSFLEQTVPNEKIIELAKERSLRLAREREKQGKPVKKSRQKLNPESKRKGLTGTEKKSLFQSQASREGRQSEVGININTWGDRENDENMDYGKSTIKWASDKPTDTLNIVSGRRLVNECIQCGLHSLYESRDDECNFFNLY